MTLREDPQSLIGKVVFPIRIPTPFAVGDVYSYLIHDEKIVLVDCGQAGEEAYERVTGQLAERDLRVDDIDEIWLTHGHPDHFGQAARLAGEAGARLYGHRKERANFAGNDDRELFGEFFRRHSIPQKLIGMMVDQLDWLQQFQEAIEPNWVEEGERLRSGDLRFEVRHTPGHAPGHLMLREDSGLMFGGDVLLGHISTNALINFDPDTGERNRSLLQYRDSLKWVRDRSGYLLPGHGTFIEDIAQVAGHHLEEHEKRYAKIIKRLNDQPFTLFELARHTFPEPMRKGDVFLVLSEVMGYLDWGLEENTVEQVEEDGQILYRSAPEA